MSVNEIVKTYYQMLARLMTILEIDIDAASGTQVSDAAKTPPKTRRRTSTDSTDPSESSTCGNTARQSREGSPDDDD